MSERSLPVLAAGTIALAACSALEPPPPVDQVQRGFEIPPAQVESRIRAWLQDAGFEISQPADGVIEGRLTYEDQRDWAWCPSRRVKDRGSDRRQLARPVDWTSTLEARTSAGGDETQVVVRTEHEQTLLNGFINWTFENACRSTGALERLVLDAVPSAG